MIQRVQSIYFFLASMAAGALLMPSMALYKYALPGTGLTPMLMPKVLTATNFIPLLLIAVVMAILPLIAIFMFKDRKRQRGFAIISILSSISFYTVMMMRVGSIRNSVPAPVSDSYGIVGVVLPVLAIVFLALALRGIRADNKLIRDAERLR